MMVLKWRETIWMWDWAKHADDTVSIAEAF